ncbi:hypothetical protein CCMA1212_005755 [Trichoderma ghanense]|uniref:Uncharacterized protein n=1 Tax=Trichoderma ghanense TaxID=65468 RepID=A0ABY2H373_9HYPO
MLSSPSNAIGKSMTERTQQSGISALSSDKDPVPERHAPPRGGWVGDCASLSIRDPLRNQPASQPLGQLWQHRGCGRFRPAGLPFFGPVLPPTGSWTTAPYMASCLAALMRIILALQRLPRAVRSAGMPACLRVCMYIHAGGTYSKGKPTSLMPALLLCARACKVPFVWTAAARLKITATLCRIDGGSAPPVPRPLCCRSLDKVPHQISEHLVRYDAMLFCWRHAGGCISWELRAWDLGYGTARLCDMDPNMGPRMLATTSKPALPGCYLCKCLRAQRRVTSTGTSGEPCLGTFNLSQREERIYRLGNSQAIRVDA